jgi:hypothetical protein
VTEEQTVNHRDRLRLLERRDALDTEMRRLGKIDEASAAAESALAALDAEQREIDRAQSDSRATK